MSSSVWCVSPILAGAARHFARVPPLNENLHDRRYCGNCDTPNPVVLSALMAIFIHTIWMIQTHASQCVPSSSFASVLIGDWCVLRTTANARRERRIPMHVYAASETKLYVNLAQRHTNTLIRATLFIHWVKCIPNLGLFAFAINEFGSLKIESNARNI